MRNMFDTPSNRLLFILFVMIWVIAVVDMVAELRYWYWIYRWLDIPMHFAGGVWVGLAAAWLRYHSGYLRKREGPPTKPLTVIVGGGLTFGLLWELYEFLVWTIGGAGLPLGYVPDTLLDLLMDVLGACVAYGVYKFALQASPQAALEPVTAMDTTKQPLE